MVELVSGQAEFAPANLDHKIRIVVDDAFQGRVDSDPGNIGEKSCIFGKNLFSFFLFRGRFSQEAEDRRRPDFIELSVGSGLNNIFFVSGKPEIFRSASARSFMEGRLKTSAPPSMV